MFFIQKCVRKQVKAQYIARESRLWVDAWDYKKSYINGSADEAIQSFYQLTSRVRNVPYRLVALEGHSYTTLAAINTVDEMSFKKYTIFAVSFTEGPKQTTAPVQECVGAVVSGSGGVIVGSCAGAKDNGVQMIVDNAAAILSENISSHKVTTRYNSDGQSGGAFLVTDATDGIMSNSDIGITYSDLTNKITLSISSKYLANATFGNSINPWDGSIEHESTHKTVQEAMAMLRKACKHANEEEALLLVA